MWRPELKRKRKEKVAGVLHQGPQVKGCACCKSPGAAVFETETGQKKFLQGSAGAANCYYLLGWCVAHHGAKLVDGAGDVYEGTVADNGQLDDRDGYDAFARHFAEALKVLGRLKLQDDFFHKRAMSGESRAVNVGFGISAHVRCWRQGACRSCSAACAAQNSGRLR